MKILIRDELGTMEYSIDDGTADFSEGYVYFVSNGIDHKIKVENIIGIYLTNINHVF